MYLETLGWGGLSLLQLHSEPPHPTDKSLRLCVTVSGRLQTRIYVNVGPINGYVNLRLGDKYFTRGIFYLLDIQTEHVWEIKKTGFLLVLFCNVSASVCFLHLHESSFSACSGLPSLFDKLQHKQKRMQSGVKTGLICLFLRMHTISLFKMTPFSDNSNWKLNNARRISVFQTLKRLNNVGMWLELGIRTAFLPSDECYSSCCWPTLGLNLQVWSYLIWDWDLWGRRRI